MRLLSPIRRSGIESEHAEAPRVLLVSQSSTQPEVCRLRGLSHHEARLDAVRRDARRGIHPVQFQARASHQESGVREMPSDHRGARRPTPHGCAGHQRRARTAAQFNLLELSRSRKRTGVQPMSHQRNAVLRLCSEACKDSHSLAQLVTAPVIYFRRLRTPGYLVHCLLSE